MLFGVFGVSILFAVHQFILYRAPEEFKRQMKGTIFCCCLFFLFFQLLFDRKFRVKKRWWSVLFFSLDLFRWRCFFVSQLFRAFHFLVDLCLLHKTNLYNFHDDNIFFLSPDFFLLPISRHHQGSFSSICSIQGSILMFWLAHTAAYRTLRLDFMWQQ